MSGAKLVTAGRTGVLALTVTEAVHELGCTRAGRCCLLADGRAAGATREPDTAAAMSVAMSVAMAATIRIALLWRRSSRSSSVVESARRDGRDSIVVEGLQSRREEVEGLLGHSGMLRLEQGDDGVEESAGHDRGLVQAHLGRLRVCWPQRWCERYAAR